MPGRGIAECEVMVDGTLANCSVVAERPAGAGFGPATVRVAPRFKMAPPMLDGHPVSGVRVQVPLRWRVNDENAPLSVADLGPRPSLNVGIAEYSDDLRSLALELDAGHSACAERGVFSRGVEQGYSFRQMAPLRRETATAGPVVERLLVLGCDVATPIDLVVWRDASKTLQVIQAPPELSRELASKDRTRPPAMYVNYPEQSIPPPPASSRAVRDEGLISAPQWSTRITYEQLLHVYPVQAMIYAVEGQTVTDCAVSASGVLDSCVPVWEAPAGFGFGSAALKLAPKFRLQPPGDAPLTAASHVHVVLGWRLPLPWLVRSRS